MRKTLLFVLLLASFLFGEDVSESSIEMHAKVYPQILSFSTNQKQKQLDTILLEVVYSEDFETEADSFRAFTDKYFGGVIRDKKLEVILIPERAFSKSRSNVAGVYILSSTGNSVNIIKELNKKSVITFAGLPSALKNGTLFGLRLSDRVTILLNKKTFQLGGYGFDSSLMRTVKIYESE